jgi:hypothetical protein
LHRFSGLVAAQPSGFYKRKRTNEERSMPARRALRTLNTSLDLAVFLWRRYGSSSQRPAPEADAGPVVPIDRETLVSVAEDTRAGDLSPEHTQTVKFGLDGQHYAIDVSDETAAELREMLGRYIAAGRRAGAPSRAASAAPGRPRAGQPASANGQDAAAIRQWARAHGHQVSERGRIPVKVRQAYDARGRSRAG